MPQRAHQAASPRVRVRRLPERGRYDSEAIDAVLDAGLVAHLGFVTEGQPYVIPTLHARLDEIVLARSVFEHSMNYRSVVVLGTATSVDEPDEKLVALEAFTEKLLPGRWAEARRPNQKELKATSVLRLPLDETSAKIRD